MSAAVIVFPGSNCDRDCKVAVERSTGEPVSMVWHAETELPQGLDLIVIPGGFSYGDYLRCGAIAAQSPIAKAIRAHAARGGFVLGVCNGFQVLTEAGLLPGALMRNAGLQFICREVELEVASAESAYTAGFGRGERIRVPVAHHDGNYQIDAEGLAALRDQDRIAFTYAPAINGSIADIAGVMSENRRVLGMMPHPERAAEAQHGGTDGARLFRSLIAGVVAA